MGHSLALAMGSRRKLGTPTTADRSDLHDSRRNSPGECLSALNRHVWAWIVVARGLI